jgi:protoheme ferro-lyase
MRIAVMCLTYGEPAQNRFWPQFNYSWSILNRLTRRVAPIPLFVTPLLAARRGLQRAIKFNQLGWNSPLEQYSQQQVDALKAELTARQPDVQWDVHLVCEFRDPYLASFLKTMKDDPPDEIIMVPLYVADSDFTSGVSRTDLERFDRQVRRQLGRNPLPAPRYLAGFGFDERAGKLIADFIWNQVEQAGWTESDTRESVLILGAHGTVIFPPPGVNNSAKETRFLFGLVRKHLRPKFADVRIGWLNHVLGGVWTKPEVMDSARESQARGIKKVVYYPFGFVADNGETQLEGRVQLEPFEWEAMLYLACPNACPGFIRLTADRIQERLAGPAGEWETIGRGDPALEYPEPAPKLGKQGPFNYNAPVLAGIALVFWLALGGMLLSRGVESLLRVPEPGWQIFLVAVGLAFGIYKGWDILAPVSRRNLLRLRRLPQPSPVWMVFGRATWYIILLMMVLGMSLRFLPLPDGLRAGVLIAVGTGMLIGAANYVRLFHLVRAPHASRSLRATSA